MVTTIKEENEKLDKILNKLASNDKQIAVEVELMNKRIAAFNKLVDLVIPLKES